MSNRAAHHGVLSFLCGAAADRGTVCYGTPDSASAAARVVILPSGFFANGTYGHPASLPVPPLEEIDGTPLLFGRSRIERQSGPDGTPRLIVHADLVASAYFLLTRYEEIVRRETRDAHGRFPGKESLPYRAGFLQRPIVDEYAALLRKWLREVGVPAADPPPRIRKIHLTHDVDSPWAWATLGAAAAGIGRHPARFWEPLFSYWGWTENRDPQDCFQWILERDGAVRASLGAARVESTYFMLAAEGGEHDGRDYLHDRRMKRLLGRFIGHEATIGLHASYAAGKDPTRLPAEKARLERASGRACRCNRHHFLAAREPEDLSALESAGFTDDFTMGYADVAGFRLGTCRPVPWFDPVALRATNLVLHPMTAMDCTLDRKRYMNLDYEGAKSACCTLLAEVRKHNGEAVLLWHNTELSETAAARGSYQRKLYQDLLSHLQEFP